MINGVYTALITPFLEDLSIDYEGFKKNIRFQIQSKVDGIVVLGTTGESPAITPVEQSKLISAAVEEAKGNIAVWVGTGSPSTEETVKKTLQAKDLGADGALVVTPYYNRPTQEGLYAHFKTVADQSKFPIMLYSIAGRTGVNLAPDTVCRLMEIPEIIAIKEASGNMSQIMEVIHRSRPGFSVLAGDDALTLPVVAAGGTGIVSVLSNLIPEEIVSLCQAALAGDFNTAKEWQTKLFPLFQTAFIESNPSPIKAMMNEFKMAAGSVRLPLVPVTPRNHQEIIKCLNETLILQN